MNPLFLGIDPDLHHTGLAVVDEFGRVLGVECVCLERKYTGEEAVVKMSRAIGAVIGMIRDHTPGVNNVIVEGQTISFKQTADPDSIIKLAHVTGACVGAANELLECNVRIPKPREWKGQVPKQIHQQRVLDHLSWKYELHGSPKNGYASPVDPPVGKKLKATHWKHVVDAIGLAQWGRKQHQRASIIIAARNRKDQNAPASQQPDSLH